MKITCVFILLFLFQLNVNAQNDCPDAIIVCGDANYFNLEAEGEGEMPEINPNNACASGENNTIWLKIQINQGGTLGFILTPEEDDLVIDFDFWLFGPIEECGTIGTAIRCSTTNPLQAGLDYITTGMNETEEDISEGPGPDGNAFVNWITVENNEFYYLVIDRPHGFGNFSMEWTGTATFHAVPVFLNPDNIPLDITQCDKDGVNDNSTTFDLTVYEEMFIGAQNPVAVTYHKNLNDVTTGQNPILVPEAYSNTSNPQIMFLRMTNTVTGCYSTQTFTIATTPPIRAGQPLNMELCDINKNGVRTFDLSANDDLVINGNTDTFVTYHTSLQNAKNGVAPVGPLFENQTPTQTIWARLQDPEGCFSYDFYSFTITVTPLPEFRNPNNIAIDLAQCDDDGVNDKKSEFNLTIHQTMFTGGFDNLVITYYENEDDAIGGTDAIDTPEAYTNISNPQTIYMRLVDTDTGCVNTSSFTITVLNISAGEPQDLFLCDTDENGIQEFNLALNDENVRNGEIDSEVSYYTSEDNAINEISPIGPLYQNLVPYEQQTIWVRLEKNNTGCLGEDIKLFTLNIIPLPVFLNPNNISFDLSKCDDDGVEDESTNFDLTVHKATMIGNRSNMKITYYDNEIDARNGDDFLLTPDVYPNTSNPQTIYIRLEDTVSGCVQIGSFDLHIVPPPDVNEQEPLQVCDFNNDGFAEFNLDGVIQQITNEMGNVTVTIHETPEDALFGVHIITNTDQYPTIHPHTQIVYIRVESNLSHCFDTTPLLLIVNPVPEATTPGEPYALCDNGSDDNDGIATFDLSTTITEILGNIDPLLFGVTFHESKDDAIAGTPQIPNPLSYSSANTTIYVRVTNNATGCYDIVELELIVNPLPAALQPTEPVIELCDVTAPANDEKEIFDLTTAIPAIIEDQQGLIVTFHHNYDDALANTNQIATPETYQNIRKGVETLFVRVTDDITGCYRIVLADIKVNPIPIILEPTPEDLTVCDTNGEGIGEFDLESLVEAMKNGEPNLVITFHLTIEDASNDLHAIPNPDNFKNNISATQNIYVRVENTLTGCYNTYQITLIVQPAPQAPSLTDIIQCDHDENGQDGKSKFDLTVQNQVIYDALGLTETDLTIHYFEEEAQAHAGTPRITNPSTYRGTNGQRIWVRVADKTNKCYSLTSFVLILHQPLFLITPSILAVCNEALPNDALAVFDLTTKNNEILGPLGIGQDFTIAYYEIDPRTNPTALPIADPTAYMIPTKGAKTLFVVVTSEEGCKSYTTLTLKVLPLPVPDTTPNDLVVCDDKNSPDGIEEFDLTEAEDDIRNNDNTAKITYHKIPEDAEAGINAIADPTVYPSATGSVWVRMEANTNNPADPKCYQVVELKLVVNPLPAIGDANGNVPPYAICAQNSTGIAIFDLNSHIEKILGNNAADDYDIEFYFDQAALDAGTALPRLYQNVVANSQTILVVVTNKETGCTIIKPLQLLAEESAIANPILITETPLFRCDDDDTNDGFHEFDLTEVEAEVLGTQSPDQFKITYHLSEEEANSDAPQGDNPITDPTAFVNTIQVGQTIWVRVTNISTVSKCHDVTSFDIVVEQLPEPVIQGGTICVDKLTNDILSPFVIDTGLDNSYEFVWYKDGEIINGETRPTLTVTSPGEYTVTAISAAGCESAAIAPVTIIQSGPASKVGVGYYISNAFSDNQTITVDVNGYGEYEYRLDEGPWQESPVFTNVSPGQHTITVRDIKTDNPCEDLIIIGASIIDYPNFFTPNNDGFRDTWNIIGLDQADAKIYIFDRYGKLLKQLSALGEGWDGTFIGANMPASDYWFTVTYREVVGTVEVTKEFKAHFSLLR